LAMSVEQTAAYFAARYDITEPPTMTNLPHRAESGTPRSSARITSRAASLLSLYCVRGGCHTIPGPSRAPFILGRKIAT
jgi:polyhydroxybutyrate depolymerase